jgi:hypothetical protein
MKIAMRTMIIHGCLLVAAKRAALSKPGIACTNGLYSMVICPVALSVSRKLVWQGIMVPGTIDVS